MGDYFKQLQGMKNGTILPETKVVKSKDLAALLPKNMPLANNGSFANVQRGDYECSKGLVFFRSKWEANYALYLDFLVKNGDKKGWEYESETFFFDKIKLGTRSYRTDFTVTNNDDSVEYHEVKGFMTSKSKTQLKRMKKYFPQIKLVLIEKAFYMDMMKKMGGIIKFFN